MELINDKIYLSYNTLSERYSIPKGTIDCGKYMFSQSKSLSWQYIELDGKAYFLYDALPKQTKEKLPALSDLKAVFVENKYSQDIAFLTSIFEKLKMQHGSYFNIIKEKYQFKDEDCRDAARKWKVLEYIIEKGIVKDYGYEVLYPAYLKAFPNSYDKSSFYNLISNCYNQGIEANVIDKRKIVKVQPRISAFQYQFIRMLWIDPRKWSAAEIHRKLVDACHKIDEKPYSLASVNLYVKQISKDTDAYTARYGASETQKQTAHASLIPALNIHDQWQLDGWTLPFWGENFQRYVIYIIIDNHSRKIVGKAIGKTENTVLILEALDDAWRNTGYSAAEYVFDRHSFQRTKNAAWIKQGLENMGVTWTETMNPQAKAIVERYTQYLDAHCKEYAGYLGKGVRSKGKDARLSPEQYDELRKKHNMLTEEEIKAIALNVVLTYNNAPLKPLKGISPNNKYAASVPVNGIKITEEKRISLIKPVAKITVSSNQITIKRGIVPHEFQLPASLAAKYHNEELHIVYEDLEQGIYLYAPDSDNCLGFIEPKQKIHGAIANQTEEDIKRLNRLTGRKKGTASKARKSENEKLQKALQANPDAIDLISSYAMPKDIRKEAEQSRELNRELRDANINPENLPIRKKAVTVANTYIASKGKTKNSPFQPENNVITKKSIDSFYKDSL